MIEWRWGLEPFTVRDAGAANLAEVLDFTAPQLAPPVYAVPVGPFGSVCPDSFEFSRDTVGNVINWIKGKTLETSNTLEGHGQRFPGQRRFIAWTPALLIGSFIESGTNGAG